MNIDMRICGNDWSFAIAQRIRDRKTVLATNHPDSTRCMATVTTVDNWIHVVDVEFLKHLNPQGPRIQRCAIAYRIATSRYWYFTGRILERETGDVRIKERCDKMVALCKEFGADILDPTANRKLLETHKRLQLTWRATNVR